MKAGVIFTGTGPILILTSYESLVSEGFSSKLAQKGIKKYIAGEVDPEICRRRYGRHFDSIVADLGSAEDLRVLDYNGHNVFNLFSFDELGKLLFLEGKS
ncbi:MAG: hypothetical protein V1816_08825 [Pseudomonadota bacterium]